MSPHRLFILAPSLARLLQRQEGSERVLEGYFPDQPHRSVSVLVTESRSSLVVSYSSEGAAEEPTDIPLAQAQALLAVTAGQVEYVRTSLTLGSHQIQVRHFLRPGPLDLVTVDVEPEDQELFRRPWFGPEVSAEAAYGCRRIALDGVPAVPEVELTDEALNSLLDLLENGSATWPQPDQAALSDKPALEQSMSPDPSVAMPPRDVDQDLNDLGIEDDVIRELARSLRPQRS